MDWLLFLVATALVFVAGDRLTHHCHVLAIKTNIGQAFVGAIILATVTSLPELSSTIAAATVAGEPALAIGNVFGSNQINITIIATLWLLIGFPKKHNESVIRTSFLAIFLSTVISGGIFFHAVTVPALMVNPVNLFLTLFFIAHLVWSFRNSSTDTDEDDDGDHDKVRNDLDKPLKITVIKIVALALLIVASGIMLSTSADRIATNVGLTKTFAGTVLLGVTTSLPELVVTWTAIRRGLGSMAFGNILGSSSFNIGVLVLTDYIYRTDNLFGSSTLVHLFQAQSALFLTFLGLIAYRLKDVKKLNKFIAIFIILFYLFSLWIIYNDMAGLA